VPSALILDGTAEAIPLPDGSVDAVVVAQAFHWFDAPRALAEIARVLREGGGFALLWNERDDEVPWVAQVSRAMHRRTAERPFDPDRAWSAVVARAGAFSPLLERKVRFEQEVDTELLVERAASSSYIAAMPLEQRAPLLDEVRAAVAGFAEPFPLPYVCKVQWCHRSSGSPS
jgi:SAM-dependent methyltransferase